MKINLWKIIKNLMIGVVVLLLLAMPTLAAAVRITCGDGNNEGLQNSTGAWLPRGTPVTINVTGIPPINTQIGADYPPLIDAQGRFIRDITASEGNSITISITSYTNPATGNTENWSNSTIVPRGVFDFWTYNIGAGWYNQSGVGVPGTAPGGGTPISPPPNAIAGQTIALPGVPQNTREESVDHDSARLRWNAPATGGAVERYEVNFNSGGWVSVGTNTYRDVSPLSPSTAYNWQVRAVNAAGNGSAASDNFTTSAAPDRDAPFAPTDVEVSPRGWTATNSFNISWTNPPDPSAIVGKYYKLDSAPTSNTDGTLVGDAPFNSLSNIRVSGDGDHTIYIWLRDGMGNVDYRNNNSQGRLKYDGTAPSAPSEVRDGTGATDIDETAFTTQLSANWPAVPTDVSGNTYQYAIGTTRDGTDVVNWTPSNNNGQDPRADKSGLTLTIGQTYYFSVRTVNGAGLSSLVVNSDGVRVVAPGHIIVTESSVNRTITQGQNASPATFTVSNTGGTNITGLNASTLPTWISSIVFTPSTTVNAGGSVTGTITFNTAGLAAQASAHTSTITISGTDSDNTGALIISVTVNSLGHITFSSIPVNAVVTRGENAPNATFTINNTGQTQITGLSASESADWIAGVDLSAATIPAGGSVTATIRFSASGKTAGSYFTDIIVSGTGVDNSPQNARVNLNVTTATLNSIAITPTNPTIVINGTQQFRAMGTYSDGITQDITSSVAWSSSDRAIADIDRAGLATGRAAGSTTISAVLSGRTGTTTLTISAATLRSITIAPIDPTITVGGTQQFTATGLYSDGTSRDISSSVTWNSSDPNILTVMSTGLVSALRVGNATLRATLGDVNVSVAITTIPVVITPTITVTSPDANSILIIGQSAKINWTSSNVSGNVKIEITRDNGASWSEISPSTANDLTEDWVITSPSSESCRIKISSVSDATIKAESATFKIHEPTYADPLIERINPNEGFIGQAVDIIGKRFGEEKKSVKFEKGSFANIITGTLINQWSAEKVTINVPRVFDGGVEVTPGDYTVKVKAKRTIVTTGISALADEDVDSNAVTFKVKAEAVTSGVIPNPFNPKSGQVATIKFGQTVANGEVYIYDITARIVKKITITNASETTWNGYFDGGEIASDGVYIIRVINANKELIAKAKALVVKR